MVHDYGFSYAGLFIERVETYHRPKWYFFGPQVECKKRVVVYRHGDLAGQSMETPTRKNEYDYDLIADRVKKILDRLEKGMERVDHIKL